MGPFRFGTVGSPLSTPKKPGGSVGSILHLRSLGLDALELGWVRSVRISDESCLGIGNAGRDSDVLISVHAPYFINLNADDVEWPKSRQRLMDAAHYGYLAGATDIIFHPGSYFGLTSAEVLPLAIDRLKGCIVELRAANNPVILRPETMGKVAMLGSLEDTLALSQEIPGVEPCIDFAHLHARPGDGSINTTSEWLDVLDLIAGTLGMQALHQLHVHLSGIEYSERGERHHLPLQESDLNLDELFLALAERGCSGRIFRQSPAMEEDALLMQRLWIQLTTA